MNLDMNALKNKKGNIMVIKYYNYNILCSIIYADPIKKEVSVQNLTKININRAFGINQNPTWKDFEAFLESRCMPRNRQNLKYELKQLGLTEYDPLLICKATNGRNYKDHQYLEFEDECEKEVPYERN